MRGEAGQLLLLCGARLPRFKQTAACPGGGARIAPHSIQHWTIRRCLSSKSDPGRARTIYVQKVGKHAYSEPLMLGLVAHLRRMFPRVGFFKPIVGMDYQPLGTQHYPRLPVVMHHTFKMKSDPAKMFAMSEDAAFRMLQQKDQAGFLEACQNKLADYQQENDVVVVDGWRRGGLSINAALAKHIDAPLLLCTEYFHSDTPKRCLERAVTEIQEYRNSNCDVLGLATSGVPMEELEEVNALLTEHLTNEGINYIGALPRMKDLEVRTLEQIYNSLKGKLLFDPHAQTEIIDTDPGAAASSSEGYPWEQNADVQARMGEPVSDFHVVTTHHGPMLSDLMRLHRPLLVTSSDRVDYISSALAAHASGVSPLSGIAITQPESLGEADAKNARATIKTVYDGLMRHEKGRAGQSQVYQMPIFTTSMDTFQVVQTISSIEPALLPSSLSKIESSIHAFDEYINSTLLMKGFATAPSKITPSRFVHNMRQKCMENPQRIVLPEAHDHRIIEAAGAAQSRGIANVILLGDKETIQQEASTIGVSLEGVTFVDPHNDDEIALKYAQALMEARKKKALPLEAAKDHLKDFNYFATMMVRCGDADGMVSGAANTTAATIRPALQVLKDDTMPLISSVFFMCLPDKVLVYGDCAVNVEPDPKQLAYIAIASADTAAAFGLEPRVALLSYSTLGSGSGPQVDKVSEATRIAQELRPDLPIVGPIQYDAAINERIAATKLKEGDSGNRAAGKANVLIFPDLNTGNNTYKAVQQSTGALAMGPIMQGLGGAVNDLSRGCTVADALDTICVTSLQAMFKKEH